MIRIKVTVEELNAMNINNMASHLGIEFTNITEDSLEARMPVIDKTKQPLGLLHGGANAVLAETLGSMASYFVVDRKQYYCVGLEIKCNHLRSATEGYVYGKTTPIHVGKRTHLWQIEIRDEKKRLTSFSTITMAILPLKEEMKKHPGLIKMQK